MISNLIFYLFRFYLYDFHRKYFRSLYRLSAILSHQFGTVAMVKSLFKPLFGMPGIFSRINGFVIRTVAIILSSIIVLGGAVIGLVTYAGLIAGLPYLFYEYFLIGVSVALFLLTYRTCFFLFFPLSKIKNPSDINEYHLAGNHSLRSLFKKLQSGNFKSIPTNFRSSDSVITFLKVSELDFQKVFEYLDANQNPANAKLYIEELLSINTQIKNNSHLTMELLFVSYLLHFVDSEEFLNKFEITTTDLISALDFANFLKIKPFTIWSDEYKLPPAGGVDKSWAVGYTSNLNKYGTDLTKLALKGLMPKLVGRETVKEEFINILSKSSRNNIMLIGQPGCGKTTFVKAMAREIAIGTKIQALRFKRIIQLDTTALQSGTPGEVNARITNIIKEVLGAGNIILFVDEIHTLAESKETNLFNAFEPHLSSAEFQFVGATTGKGYEKYIAPIASFARDFDVINMPEATDSETIEIIQHLVKKSRGTKGYPLVTFPSILTSVALSKKYLHRSVMPDKAVELFIQAVSNSKGNASNILDREFLKKVFSETFDIPVSALNIDEKKILKTLENILHESIVGQDLAITLIVNALKRSRAGVRDDKKPIASFLFSGPTGVGKTETAKALAKNYFGREDFVTRIDMSEFKDASSLSRLIGDTNGNVGILTSKVKTHPYSLLFLDEVEKANKDVLNIFLQILDDGRLTDSTGEVIDFTNTFIIMTTNAGTREVIKTIGENKSDDEITKITIEGLKDYFAPEFLNRFTALVPFTPLTMDQVRKITEIKLNNLAEKMLEKNKIKLSFDFVLIEKLSKEGFSREWGAR
ncbi:hypothetical protein COV25_03545, partial [candidate division WWE3 bacterium CG10_big_fil_rev_8_21_14_0_10_35_32]